MKIDKKSPNWFRPRNIVLSLIFFLTVGIAIPLFAGDGSENFKGTDAAAAKQAVEFLRMGNQGLAGLDAIGTVTYRAESVSLEQSGIDPKLCPKSFDDPERREPSRYTVTVSHRTIFNIQMGAISIKICSFPALR